MFVAAALLMFAGCLRAQQAQAICVDPDLMVFHPEYVHLFLVSSKTDQSMQGQWVAIASIGGQYCPVAYLKKFLTFGGYKRIRNSADEDLGPLLRACQFRTGRGLTLQQVSSTFASPIPALSYTTILERCKDIFQRAGVQGTILTHSFRIGGTSAAADAGASITLLRKLGRWVSDTMPVHYSRASLASLQHVARAMGLAAPM
jgi:hypothetical protein